MGVSAIIGGLASFLGGAGARNTAASNAAPKVQKAINSVNKVLSRQASGYYSSARYAQAALTNVANRLGKALAVQQAKMMAGALTWLGVGSAGFNFIDGFIGLFVSGW
ncbi:MAG: hypothetical protein J6C62_07645 [Clostridia bacterium]|nr:hypothetical protein [Clostridia bacterium]